MPPTESLALAAAPSPLLMGRAATLTATLTDASGNPVAGAPVTFTLGGSSSAQLDGAVATTNAAGVATTTVTDAAAETAGIMASANFGFATGAAMVTWAPALVTSVGPNTGPSAGGTKVTIHGAGFASGEVVYFGNQPAAKTVVKNGGTVVATAPYASGEIAVDVTVAQEAGSSPTSPADVFTYTYGTPGVTAVAPKNGPTAGGTLVVITGTGFVAGAAVSFGGVPAVVVGVASSGRQLTVVSPLHAKAGAVDVRVTVAGKTSATKPADRFTYAAQAPSVLAVVPDEGATRGGDTILVLGTNFIPGSTKVAFGKGGPAGVSVTVQSATALVVTTPPAKADGTVDVYVTVGKLKSAQNPDDQFTYMSEPPTISAISPTSGPAAGGSTVVITGTNFMPGTAVWFGSVPATAVTVVSGTELSVVSPPGTSGTTVDVTVQTSYPPSATLAAAYTYT